MAEGFRTLLPLGLSKAPAVTTVGVRGLFAFWIGGAGTDGTTPPTPTPTVDTGQVKGGIPGKGGKFGKPAKRRRHERVYIKIDGREIWFANEEHAIAYLRTQGAITEKRVTQAVERVAAKELPELDQTPIELPQITVRGSDEARQYAQELDRRMRQMLAMLDAQYRILLDDDDEMMLLH